MAARLKLIARRTRQFQKMPTGLPIGQVAKRLGLTYNTAKIWCRRCGYKTLKGGAYLSDGTPIRAVRKKQVAKLPRGLNFAQAAKKLGLSYNIAHHWLCEFGYKVPWHDARRRANRLRKKAARRSGRH
jgi:transposase